MAAYDRDLIAEMLETIQMTKFRQADITEQARLLREADNAEAAGVHTATQPPAVGVDVSEASIFRAADSLCGEWNLHYPDAVRMAKTALHAALRTGGGVKDMTK